MQVELFPPTRNARRSSGFDGCSNVALGGRIVTSLQSISLWLTNKIEKHQFRRCSKLHVMDAAI